MCLRLGNRHHCLTLLSILGLLQSLVSVPIIVLSFLVFFMSSLGAALSPFWCGFVLLLAGLVALVIRPTRLAFVVFFHVLLNAFAICACFLATGITGLYGTSVHLPGYDDFRRRQLLTPDNDTCIFDVDSRLYSEAFRDNLRPIDGLVGSCEDLGVFWKHLISIMSLSFVGLVISIIAIFSNCITPCVEERYDGEWSSKTDV